MSLDESVSESTIWDRCFDALVLREDTSRGTSDKFHSLLTWKSIARDHPPTAPFGLR